jgi:hypothetical protein
MPCECSNLRETGGFRDTGEYSKFLRSILESDLFQEEQPLDKLYEAGAGEERWFKCQKCNGEWRLIAPDFPFRGLWSPV